MALALRNLGLVSLLSGHVNTGSLLSAVPRCDSASSAIILVFRIVSYYNNKLGANYGGTSKLPELWGIHAKPNDSCFDPFRGYPLPTKSLFPAYQICAVRFSSLVLAIISLPECRQRLHAANLHALKVCLAYRTKLTTPAPCIRPLRLSAYRPSANRSRTRRCSERLSNR